MNRRRRRRDGGSNLRWRTEDLLQRQLRADYRASRGADDKIRSPKIDSLTSETIHQTDFPSPTHGAATTKHEGPRTVTASAVRAAVVDHFMVPSLRRAAWKQSIALCRIYAAAMSSESMKHARPISAFGALRTFAAHCTMSAAAKANIARMIFRAGREPTT
jgi:hypothetical protein